MFIRNQPIIFLTGLLMVFVEARWHDLQGIRKHMSSDLPVYSEESPTEEDPPPHRQHHRLRRHRPERFLGLSRDNDLRHVPHYRRNAEEMEEQGYRQHVARRHHRQYLSEYRQRDHAEKNLGSAWDSESDYDDEAYVDSSEDFPRSKRHNHLHDSVMYRAMNNEDRKSFVQSRGNRVAVFESNDLYEVEVREAQNSSICNYTVIPIPDPYGTRIPKDLEHVKCNYLGARCKDTGTYCCIQTYRKVEVSYGGKEREMMKIYSGCVCSLQLYGVLEPHTPGVPIGD